MNNLRKLIACIALLALMFVISCDDAEDKLAQEHVQTSDDESTLEAVTDELDDLAAVILDSEDQAGGRVRAVDDHRLACATITFQGVNETRTEGTAIVDFGTTGCEDDNGNVRMGVITISWNGGKWFQEGAFQTMSFSNYRINEIAIGGTRTLNCTSVTGTLSDFTISWDVTANHNFGFPDLSSASRLVNRTKQWHHTATENTFTVSNGPSGNFAASGTNRHERSYLVDITTPLVYEASCIRNNKVFLPVSGVKVLTDQTTEKDLTLDFGDGTCDNTFTVTVEGLTRTVTASND